MKKFYFKYLLGTLLLLCSTVASAHNFAVGGIYYNIINATAKTVGVTYSGSSPSSVAHEYTGAVTIPSTVTYNGTTYSVTSIGNDAFSFCSFLTSIEIPNSVTSIGDYAFYNCTGLTSIVIPNSVTSIGDYAFFGCYRLPGIVIPNRVTSIGNYAFYDCRGLTSIIIPNSVTSIGERAFYDCRGLTSVTIGNSVTSIGNDAFSFCSSLTSIEIPNSVTSIGGRAFDNCSGLTSVTIPNSVTSIGRSAFSCCTGLTSVTIGNSVTSIGDYAFDNCSGLTSIEIPNSVTSIGEGAFRSCSGLTSIEIPNSVTSIGEGAFDNCSGLTSITVNSGNSIYDSREGCNAIIETATNTLIAGCKNTIIPNSVTSIGDYAFYDRSGLTSIEIPNSVTSIGNYAFSGCTGLTSVKIPTSVTKIGYGAFRDCTGLTRVTIGNSVTSIGDYAFDDCSGLASVTIGNSVTSIGERAFYGCTNLKTVYNYSSLNILAGNTGNGYVAYYADKVINAPNGFIEGDFVFARTKVTSLQFTTADGLPGTVTGSNHIWESPVINSSTNGVRITVLATNGGSNMYNYNGYPIVALGELEFYDGNGNKINYTASNVTTNSLEGSEGSLAALCDGNYSTFYHSTWSGNGTTPTDYVYLDVKFPQTVDAFKIKMVGRNTKSLVPTEINVASTGGIIINNYSLVDYIGNTTALYLPENCNGNNYTIGADAFRDNTAITSIVIPNSVTSIGNDAFSSCYGLTEIYSLAETPATITYNTFDIYSATLYVPAGAKEAYQAADYWKNFTNIVEMESAETLPGDINGDNQVDVGDVTILIGMILDASLLTDSGDINGDNQVDVGDVTAVVSVILSTNNAPARATAVVEE